VSAHARFASFAETRRRLTLPSAPVDSPMNDPSVAGACTTRYASKPSVSLGSQLYAPSADRSAAVFSSSGFSQHTSCVSSLW
jgi:hypothetical protein